MTGSSLAVTGSTCGLSACRSTPGISALRLTEPVLADFRHVWVPARSG